jgi:hypothetical protein
MTGSVTMEKAMRVASQSARGSGIAASLAVLILLVAGACGPGGATWAPGTPSSSPSDAPSGEPTDAGEPSPDVSPTLAPIASSAPTATPLPVASVSSVAISETGNSAACGNWRVTFQKPVVAGVPTAAAMNAAITTQVAGYINAFKAHMASEESPGSGPCTFEGNFTVQLSSPRLLSITFAMIEYLGGASPEAEAGSINFRISSGAVLTLASLFVNEAAGANALSVRCRALLPAVLAEGADVDWINTGTPAAMASYDKAWAMKPAGLQITFPETQVAPTAEGTPSVVVTWASLSAVLSHAGPAAEFLG